MYSFPKQSNGQINWVSVVVPWWDHRELLEIWELNLLHLQKSEIIFVDNGSAHSTQVALQQFCTRHDIKLIRNEENRGFAAANNQAVEVAKGEYILHLNNDVEIFGSPFEYLCNLAGEGLSGPGPMITETGEVFVAGWRCALKNLPCKHWGDGVRTMVLVIGMTWSCVIGQD